MMFICNTIYFSKYFSKNKSIRKENPEKKTKFSTVFHFSDGFLATNDAGEYEKALFEIYPLQL